LLASRLAHDFLKLPAVKAWFETEKYRQLETARDQIEQVFKTSLAEIRDRILGDGVVFALDLLPEALNDPSQARGLLILKASDPALLHRLLDTFNTIQRNNGEIVALVPRTWKGTAYFVREFPAASQRRSDAYVTFPDGTFAISNAEEMIRHVIEGKSPGTVESGIPAVANFPILDPQLPKQALARLFIDPRMILSLLKNAHGPRSPGHVLLERYVSALKAGGAALVVHEGRVAIQTAEVFEHDKFHVLLGEWTAPAAAATVIPLDHFPACVLAVGSFRVNFPALYQGLNHLVPEADRPRLANIETVLRGILLGQDLRSRVLPNLGPRILTFVETPIDEKLNPVKGITSHPANKWPFPMVLVLELGGESKRSPGSDSSEAAGVPIAAALENALNTLLAMLTFDEQRGKGGARIVCRDVGGLSIKTLDPPIPFAFALDHQGHRLIVGNSADTVARHLTATTHPEAATRFHRIRELAFPDAQSFVCFDLAAFQSVIASHRDRLAELISSKEHRARDEVARDLDQAAALAGVFEAAFWANRIDAASASVFHTVGLLSRQPETAAVSTPKP
jgi:hypothetical protein